MGEGEVILRQLLSHRGRGGVDATELAPAVRRIGNGRGRAAELVGAEEQELAVDLGHQGSRSVPGSIAVDRAPGCAESAALRGSQRYREQPTCPEHELSTLNRRPQHAESATWRTLIHADERQHGLGARLDRGVARGLEMADRL